MTHEELQREYAQEIADGQLPAPGERFSGEAAIAGTSGQVYVRYLTYDPGARDVSVHFSYVDEPGAFAGRGTEPLEVFWVKWPVKLETL